ncbi:hypothetical protein ACFOLA_00820 [Salinicoccus hispanicus]|uniref:Uncharacterized protein n=1 Tax=Salinicoccus hispanicus TaxID=157225 RepID=A0A6N8U176_9STAP|nr:hypothetical protein [Salinicoccus hispanicus]MXQ50125.1 hypothetical protein [Salinicoccus hispanicus]
MKRISIFPIAIFVLLLSGCSNGDVLSDRTYNIKMDLEFEEMRDSSLSFPVEFSDGNIELQEGDHPTGEYSLGDNTLEMNLTDDDGNMDFKITELVALDEDADELEGTLSEFEFDSINRESQLALNVLRNGAIGSTITMTRIDDSD